MIGMRLSDCGLENQREPETNGWAVRFPGYSVFHG
jgi:hypothetical protein